MADRAMEGGSEGAEIGEDRWGASSAAAVLWGEDSPRAEHAHNLNVDGVNEAAEEGGAEGVAVEGGNGAGYCESRGQHGPQLEARRQRWRRSGRGGWQGG